MSEAIKAAAFIRGMALGYEADESEDSKMGAARLREISDIIDQQALVIRELAAALNSLADDIDLEAKFASRAGQMVNLEALASYARQAARSAVAKAKP